MNQELKSYLLLFSVIACILAIGVGFNYRPAVGMIIFILTILLWTCFPYNKYFNKWWTKKETKKKRR